MARDLAFGAPWSLTYNSLLIKLYPCCSAAHAAIDAALRFNEAQVAPWQEIEKVTVEVPSYATHNLIYTNPNTEDACRFSMTFALANALIMNRFDLSSFRQDEIRNPQLRSFFPKVKYRCKPAIHSLHLLKKSRLLFHTFTRWDRLEKACEFSDRP